MGELHTDQRGLVQEQEGLSERFALRASLARNCEKGCGRGGSCDSAAFLFAHDGRAHKARFAEWSGAPPSDFILPMEIRIELPAVRLGTVEADDVEVTAVNPALARVVDDVCARKREEFTVETLAQAEPVRAVRAMFREWGMDPSKYRPSSEALLRRVVQGKGLYRVSNIVDMGNLGSVEAGWPYGCYDRSRIRPPVAFRHGAAGERYERVGKEMWHLEGRPVLADAESAFGSPISDSTRTMVTESTREVLVVIYAPATASREALNAAMAQLSRRLSQFARSSAPRSGMSA
jgi:DNA/RNA-binding domain of Phe-tRNA-synthetase-like protein